MYGNIMTLGKRIKASVIINVHVYVVSILTELVHDSRSKYIQFTVYNR